MTLERWLDVFPLWGVFVLAMLIVLFSISAGIRIGALVKKSAASDMSSPGTVLGATLGFLAFMLALTFSMTSNRFDERKHLLVDEMSAISTAYLRAGLLHEPYASHAKKLLREYVDLRVHIIRNFATLHEDIARSDAIQDALWSDVEKIAAKHGEEYMKLYVQSLNTMMDMQDKRVAAALYFRIPGGIWIALLTVTVLAMIAVGYQFGQSENRHSLINVMLAIAFSSVIVLIADLDREAQGVITVNQQPLFDLQERLNGAP